MHTALRSHRRRTQTPYRAREPAPVGPRERRPVVPARRVAYAVIADALTVIRRQQIQPAAVTVAVHLGRRPVRYRPDVSVGVIGVGVGLAAVGLGKKLPLRIVGVRCRRAAGSCIPVPLNEPGNTALEALR